MGRVQLFDKFLPVFVFFGFRRKEEFEKNIEEMENIKEKEAGQLDSAGLKSASPA